MDLFGLALGDVNQKCKSGVQESSTRGGGSHAQTPGPLQVQDPGAALMWPGDAPLVPLLEGMGEVEIQR